MSNEGVAHPSPICVKTNLAEALVFPRTVQTVQDIPAKGHKCGIIIISELIMGRTVMGSMIWPLTQPDDRLNNFKAQKAHPADFGWAIVVVGLSILALWLIEEL